MMINLWERKGYGKSAKVGRGDPGTPGLAAASHIGGQDGLTHRSLKI